MPEEETHEQRRERYAKSYDVDTLARMCVDTEREYEAQARTIVLLKTRIRRLTGALSEARTGFQGLVQKAEEYRSWADDAIKRRR